MIIGSIRTNLTDSVGTASIIAHEFLCHVNKSDASKLEEPFYEAAPLCFHIKKGGKGLWKIETRETKTLWINR